MLSRYSPRYAYASCACGKKNVDMSREHRRVTDGCTNKQRPVPMIYCHTNTKDERRHDGPANVTYIRRWQFGTLVVDGWAVTSGRVIAVGIWYTDR